MPLPRDEGASKDLPNKVAEDDGANHSCLEGGKGGKKHGVVFDVFQGYYHGNLRVPPLCHPPQKIRPYLLGGGTGGAPLGSHDIKVEHIEVPKKHWSQICR